MNAHDLARWTRFASKGGIGRCTAVVDCVAQEMGEDLMFLKDDEITVLMQLPEEGFYLGHCEGVVGRFSAKDVRFHGKLKKPVITKRTSVASGAERMSIAVAERHPSMKLGRSDGKKNSDGHSTVWLREPCRSPSPTLSEKSLSQSFATGTSFKLGGEDRDSKESKSPKVPRSTGSVSGSSVYSARSRRSASTTTSVSAYSTSGSVSGSGVSGATETDHTGFNASPPSASFPSGTDSNDTRGSVDVKLCADDREPVAIIIPSPASGFGLGTAASVPNSSPTLPIVAPLRLSKSPRQTPANLPSGSSPLPSPSSGAPSVGIPGSLSSGLPGSCPSLNSPLSLAPPRSFSSASPVPSSGLSGSLSPALSLSSGFPGSHSPSPRSPTFPSRTQVHVSSGASTSSSPLPNPYGPGSTSLYVTLSGGLMSITPPPSAPPTGPLPPAPSPGEVHETRTEKGMSEELGHGDDFDEGNSTRLSTLDAFRREFRDEDEDDGNVAFRSEDEKDAMVSGSWLNNVSGTPDDRNSEQGDIKTGKKTSLRNNSQKGDSKVPANGEDGNSDGEVGIGLSLMGSLNGDCDDSDEDVPLGVVRDNLGAMTPGSSGSTPMPWSRRTPVASEATLSHGQMTTRHAATSPIRAEGGEDLTGSENLSPESSHEADEELEGTEDEEGGYWDDIYDDYRYSRYSLTSKRFSVASRRMSVVSKMSAGSKTSGTSKGSRPPPVPVPIFPTERPSFSVNRPSFSTDRSFEQRSVTSDQPSQYSVRDERPSLYSRPSFESTSTAASAESSASQRNEHPLTQSFDPSLSDDTRSSLYSTQTLDRLSSQFPAVPTGVPVRVESRLRIVNDGHVERGEDTHLEMEMEVMHESTEDHVTEGAAVEAKAGRTLVAGNHIQQTDGTSTNAAVSSSLLRSTSPRPPWTPADTEDGPEYTRDSVDQYPNEADLPTGALKSPFESPDVSAEGGALALASRAVMDSKHGSVSPNAIDSSSRNVPTSRFQMTATLVDDDHCVQLPDRRGDHSFVSNHSDVLPTNNLPPTSNVPTPPLTPTEPDAPQHPRSLNRTVHPFSRSSIFLPHPNAPKPVGHQGLGPMYARPAQAQPYPVSPPNVEPGSNLYPQPPPNSSPFAVPVLHRLRSASLAQGSTPPHRPPMTIFARCQPDLSASMGPVPIVFSLEPLPPLTSSASGPTPHSPNSTTVMPPIRSATLPPLAHKGLLGENLSPPFRGRAPAPDVCIPRETKAEVPGPTEQPSLRLPRRSATSSSTQPVAVKEATQVTTATLPALRPGFVPQVGGARGARPRSRSFSALGAKVVGAEVSERSRDQLTGAFIPRRVPSPLTFITGPATVSNVSAVGLQPATSSSPLPVGSASTFPAPAPSPVAGERDTLNPAGNVSPLPNLQSPTSPQPSAQNRSASPGGHEKDSTNSHPPRRSSDSCDSHSFMESPPPVQDSSQNNRSFPLMQEAALRNKLSLPTLRGKSNTRPWLDDAISIASSHTGLGGSIENETVQVQDMDFELVKPSIPLISGRASQDSVAGQEARLDPTSPGLLADTASMHSSAPRSPLATNEQASGAATDIQAAADAHRQREVRWMALLPAVSPSQARKNKKVKRLLQDGVPSSLRYLVWCHLTDSKARALPGVYTKLGKRPHVPAFMEIGKDAIRCFPDQPQLHNTNGPIVSLLQAYLSMVPDIQYSSALTSIAGHLLLLAPEEDAFWIFASVMDAHLRSYFSASTIQIEVDAALLSKAVEFNDPALHKKLYVSLQMAPASITRPWFSSLFVGTLPVDHLHRIWDIFLYEGMPFLFRVGLAVIHCVRHLLLQATSDESALGNLTHPPVACLPSSADDFLSLCFSMKLKDDDVRKQRVKMEAQVKRQTQARTHAMNGIPSRQAKSISLPRS